MSDGPRSPGFWLYGEEKQPDLGGFSTKSSHPRYKCPRCGRIITSSTGAIKCFKCKVMMRRI